MTFIAVYSEPGAPADRAWPKAPFKHGDYDPGRRFYFFDRDEIEFGIVSYA